LVLVVATAWGMTLRRAVLTQHLARPALGDPEKGPNMIDTLATARGAQKFPRAASLRICLSRLRSETAVHSRAKRNRMMEADFNVFAKLGEESFDG
jgi:hypothetical protein